MSRICPLAACILLGAGSPVSAQGNLDAGKSPAQIFSSTCANCHRSPSQVRRASASFLRSHYMTGAEEASAMARYLAGVPGEPRGQQKKKDAGKPRETPADRAGRGRQEEGKEQSREQAKEQPRGPAGSSREHRPSAAEAKPATPAAVEPAVPVADVKPPESAVAPAPPPAAAPAPPPPTLPPFEE
jgi:hypothetical protein